MIFVDVVTEGFVALDSVGVFLVKNVLKKTAPSVHAL